MKKLVSLLLVVVMVASLGTFSAFSETAPEQNMYKEKFEQEYGKTLMYHELDIRFTDEGVRWVLIQAFTYLIAVDPLPNAAPNYAVNGDVAISKKNICEPFETVFCVYDEGKDLFIDLAYIDFDYYDGLQELIVSLGSCVYIGDIDYDGTISVLDATKIQRVLAKLVDSNDITIMDYNRDGCADVLDATAIQRKLAGLDKDPNQEPEETPDQAFPIVPTECDHY